MKDMYYEAKIDCTGELLFGEFRWVYQKARESLRGFLHDALYYTFESVTIIAYEILDDGSVVPDHVAGIIYGHGIDHKVRTETIH